MRAIFLWMVFILDGIEPRLLLNKGKHPPCWVRGRCVDRDTLAGSVTYSTTKQNITRRKCIEQCAVHGANDCKSFTFNRDNLTCDVFNAPCKAVKQDCKRCSTWSGICGVLYLNSPKSNKTTLSFKSLSNVLNCDGISLDKCDEKEPVHIEEDIGDVSCQQKCEESNECKSFVFEEETRLCKLFSSDLKSYVDGCTKIGSKRSCIRMPNDCVFLNGMCSVNGTKIESSKKIRSYEQCQQLCILNEDCKYFFFDALKHDCDIFDSGETSCKSMIAAKTPSIEMCSRKLEAMQSTPVDEFFSTPRPKLVHIPMKKKTNSEITSELLPSLNIAENSTKNNTSSKQSQKHEVLVSRGGEGGKNTPRILKNLEPKSLDANKTLLTSIVPTTPSTIGRPTLEMYDDLETEYYSEEGKGSGPTEADSAETGKDESVVMTYLSAVSEQRFSPKFFKLSSAKPEPQEEISESDFEIKEEKIRDPLESSGLKSNHSTQKQTKNRALSGSSSPFRSKSKPAKQGPAKGASLIEEESEIFGNWQTEVPSEDEEVTEVHQKIVAKHPEKSLEKGSTVSDILDKQKEIFTTEGELQGEGPSGLSEKKLNRKNKVQTLSKSNDKLATQGEFQGEGHLIKNETKLERQNKTHPSDKKKKISTGDELPSEGKQLVVNDTKLDHHDKTQMKTHPSEKKKKISTTDELLSEGHLMPNETKLDQHDKTQMGHHPNGKMNEILKLKGVLPGEGPLAKNKTELGHENKDLLKRHTAGKMKNRGDMKNDSHVMDPSSKGKLLTTKSEVLSGLTGPTTMSSSKDQTTTIIQSSSSSIDLEASTVNDYEDEEETTSNIEQGQSQADSELPEFGINSTPSVKQKLLKQQQSLVKSAPKETKRGLKQGFRTSKIANETPEETSGAGTDENAKNDSFGNKALKFLVDTSKRIQDSILGRSVPRAETGKNKIEAAPKKSTSSSSLANEKEGRESLIITTPKSEPNTTTLFSLKSRSNISDLQDSLAKETTEQTRFGDNQTRKSSADFDRKSFRHKLRSKFRSLSFTASPASGNKTAQEENESTIKRNQTSSEPRTVMECLGCSAKLKSFVVKCKFQILFNDEFSHCIDQATKSLNHCLPCICDMLKVYTNIKCHV